MDRSGSLDRWATRTFRLMLATLFALVGLVGGPGVLAQSRHHHHGRLHAAEGPESTETSDPSPPVASPALPTPAPSAVALPTAPTPPTTTGPLRAPTAPAEPPAHTTNLLAMPDRVPLPLPVGVALLAESVGKINEQAGTFEATVTIRQRWRDPNLAFDARTLGADRQEFTGEAATTRLSSMWSPRVTIANLNNRDAPEDPGLVLFADGTVQYFIRIHATFDMRYRLAAFPFDTQGLTIRLLSGTYSDNQVVLVQEQDDLDATALQSGLEISGWSPLRVEFARSRSLRWNGDTLPAMEARIMVQRDAGVHLFYIFVPLLMIMLVPTAILFFAESTVENRMSMWSNAGLAMVALTFTMQVSYPALGIDSLVGQVLTISFGNTVLLTLMTLTVISPEFMARFGRRHFSDALRDVLGWATPLAYCVLLFSRTFLTALN